MTQVIDENPNGMGRLLTRRRALGGAAGLAMGAPRVARARSLPADTLVYAMSAYPPNLKPFENTGTAAVTVKSQFLRGLLGYDTDGNVGNEIAESWSRDGDRAFVFKIRENAVFQNGAPVTSADVKYTYAAIADAKSTAYLRSGFQAIETIETPDAKTCRIVLRAPSASFQYLVASPYAPIICAKAAMADPNDIVGAGPYSIVSIERGTRVELKRFAQYYKPGFPKSEKLSLIAYADDSARVAALLAGDVDIIEQVPWQNMTDLAANPGFVQSSTQFGPFLYLVFNMKTGRFTDARLRRAVAYALKRDDMVKAAMFGHGAPLDTLPILSTDPLFDPSVGKLWPYDPDRSRALLKEAGLPNGFSTTILSAGSYGMTKDACVVMQQNLADVGINVELKLTDFATRVSLGTKGQYELSMNSTGVDFNDPDAWSALVGSGLSADYHRPYGYENVEAAKLLDQGRQELDPAKRRAIYAQLQRVVAEDTPLIMAAWRAQAFGMSRAVKDCTILPGCISLYSGCNLEHASVA